MPDQVDQSQTTAPVPAPTQPQVGDPAPVAVTIANPAKSDGFTVSFDEWRDTRKELRQAMELLKKAAPTPAKADPPATAPAPDGDLAAQVATLRRENALNRAFADHGIKPGKLRDFMEKQAARLDPGEIGAFVADALGAVAADAPASAAASVQSLTAPAAPVPAPSKLSPPPATRAPDTGPPGSLPPLPSLKDMDRNTYQSMPREERMKLAGSAIQGVQGNPFVANRKRAARP